MTWEEYRWIIVLSLVILLWILLDEWAYNGWKKANPGALYSHLFEKGPFSLIDPLKPPTKYYE